MQDIETLNRDKISKNIEEWKRKLLDFTKRNNLIYFKYSKKVHLKINQTNEFLFNLLINENKSIYLEKLDLDFSENEEDLKDLQKLLSKLRLKANSTLKEKGINTLYLCLGMLKWRESENSKIDVYSPLALLPIRIIKEGKNKPFILTSIDNGVVVNSSLMYKMQLDFGIDLYEDDCNITDIDDFLDIVKEKINNIKNWSVDKTAYIGNFTFSKISMYKDLQRYEDNIYDHEIVSKLAGFEKVYSNGELETIDNLPLEKKSEEIYQVLDADSSQQKTLVTSKAGYSFVIEGPPGTGKSQTISNIIAEAIAENKKVLFVSEKAAALEVVANRLSNVGLGDYILELHSNKANRKQVISDIYSQYIRRMNDASQNNTLFFNELDGNIGKLNNYINELHKKYSPLDKSAFDLHGELSKLSYVADLNFSIGKVEELTINKVVEMQDIARELEYKHDTLNKYKESLWTNISLDSCNLQKQKEIEELLSKLSCSIKRMDKLSNKFNSYYNTNIDTVYKVYSIRDGLNKLNHTSSYIKTYFNEKYQDKIETAIEINKNYKYKYNTISKELLNTYKYIDNLYINDNIVSILNKLKYSLEENAFNNLYNEDYRVELINDIKIINSQLDLIKENLIIKKIFGNIDNLTINKYKYLVNILEILQNGNSIPNSWFNNIEHLKNLKEVILPIIKSNINDLKSKIEKVEYYFKSELYKNERDLLINLVNLEKDELLRNKSKKLYELEDISKEDLSKFNKCISDLNMSSKEMFDKLEIKTIINIKNLEDVLMMIKLIEETPYFDKRWFQNNQLLMIKNQIGKLRKDIVKLQEQRNEINKIFKDTIYNIDYKGCYDRFRTQYTGKLRVINSSYKRDKKDIERCLIDNSGSFSYEIILSYLEKLIVYENTKEKFEDQEENYRNIFGPLMNGVDTDVTLIDSITTNLEDLLYIWNKYGQPNSIINLAIKEKPQNEIMDLISIIKYNKEIYETLLKYVGEFYGNYNELFIIDIDKLSEKVNKENEELNKILVYFDKINSLTNSSKVSFEELIDIINKALEVSKELEVLNKKQSEYKELLGDFYRGLDSNLGEIDRLLDFAIRVEVKSEELSIEEKSDLIKYIINDLDNNNKGYLISNTKEIKNNLNTLDIYLDRFIENNKGVSIYRKSPLENLKISILEHSFNELSSWLSCIDECINGLLINRKIKFTSINKLYIDINLINDLRENMNYILSFESECKELFEEKYKSFDTDWQEIEEDYNDIKNVIKVFRDSNIRLSKELINKIIDKESRMELICDVKVIKYFESIKCQIDELMMLQNNDFTIKGIKFERLLFNECINVVDNLTTQVQDIDIIIKIRNIIYKSKEFNINEFVDLALKNYNLKDNFLDVFNKRLYIIMLDNIYYNSNVLSSFDKDKFERTLSEFKKNDKKLIKMNVDRIKYLIDSRINAKIKSYGLSREFSILSHENSKKKRLLPLRTLFSRTSNVIKTLKPCIMMSPLSVSEFIDLDNFNFDMVIFDEASQICPEDAIGAMLRGKQIIIAGDKKQLPPTKFFNTSIDDNEEYDTDNDDEEDIYEGTEYESILDLASTFMKTSRLLWHYRSRHESLITFSNRNFYDNSLYTFPSTDNSENLGVKFEFANGIYDQGGSATNIIEAKKVADLVINHFKENPNRSLGVITFGSKQMDCILDMIEQTRKDYPELDKYFDDEREDAFFVKNLENVQGDERDTIILSVCYGYSDEARRRLNHNFGPINKAGGERRLNVAITRAKYKLILVSSITDSDIDLGRTKSIGANLLKDYLYFTRMGKVPESIIVDNKKRFDSPLEEDIYNELIKLGYEVDTQVGCSGYRIDLAIKDPNNRGNYLLGVECDGATYHSSKSARDRDRLRQEVLEGLGWTIHRIWSQDWFKNKQEEIINIKEKVRILKEIGN